MAGQLIDKGNNKYMVRVYLGADDNGKRKYHNKTIKGKTEAQKYLNKILHQKDTGTFVDSGKITIEKHFENWFEVVKNRVSSKTFSGYRDIVRLHIIPAIGSVRLDKLRPERIQILYNKMIEQGLSPRTVRYTNMILKNCLEQAVKWEQIYRNPATLVDLPKEKRPQTQVLNPEQAMKFMEKAIYSPLKPFFSLMITSGTRPSEALALKWDCVDFDNNRVTVARTLVRDEKGGGWSLEETKTDRSRRTIPLPPSTIADLKEHKNKQNEQKMKAKPGKYNDHNFVFAAENGEPMCRRNIIKRHFKPLLKSADLPDIRLYDLRHTCATLLLSVGENAKIVSERLGHASIVLTLDTYSHVLPDMQKSCAEKLEGILFNEAHTK